MFTAEALSAYYRHLQSRLGGLKTATIAKQYCQHVGKVMMLSFCGGHVRGLLKTKEAVEDGGLNNLNSNDLSGSMIKSYCHTVANFLAFLLGHAKDPLVEVFNDFVIPTALKAKIQEGITSSYKNQGKRRQIENKERALNK